MNNLPPAKRLFRLSTCKTEHNLVDTREKESIDTMYLNADGWMTCDFTSFSTVFQSYQDDGRLIMKGCVQWNSVYG